MVELDVLPSVDARAVDGSQSGDAPVKWAKVLNQDTCIGCHACSTACKSEHLVPLGVNRTYVKQVEVGLYPDVERQFQVTRCNQCEDAPCVTICPVTAMFKREDGIVDFDREVCIGCKACMAACPYDAIHISPESHSAEKCNFCAHRIDQGLQPACVSVCPVGAIVVGNMNDPTSEVSELIARDKVTVRKPEKGTHPKVFYVGASDYTKSPSAVAPESGYMYAERADAKNGRSAAAKSVAAARLAYDNAHRAPWHWPVSLYTWTKSISAGVSLMFAILIFSGHSLSAGFDVITAVIGGFFLAVTGVLLIYDLEHPSRFLRIFTRPQWKSWLVRGSFVIALYSVLLLVQFVLGIFGSTAGALGIAIAGTLLGGLTAIYTAFLFAQAKGRDLWQNPALPLHLLTQAIICGSGVYLILNLMMPLPGRADVIVRATFIIALVVHFALVLSERYVPHATEDGHLAAWQMTSGRYRSYYLFGFIVGAILPLCLAWFSAASHLPEVAALLAIGGLYFYEHAYVQAGQSVRLS